MAFLITASSAHSTSTGIAQGGGARPGGAQRQCHRAREGGEPRPEVAHHALRHRSQAHRLAPGRAADALEPLGHPLERSASA